jgi:hypothetical protein
MEMIIIIIIINENENVFDVLSKLLVFILARILGAQFGVFFKAVSAVYLITTGFCARCSCLDIDIGQK